MKTIKVILIIITILTVAFFATGIVINETNYTTQVHVNKPVKEVFKSFSHLENSKNWIPEIKSIEAIEEKLGKTGSTYKLIIQNNEQEIAVTQKIMAYVPNEKLTVFNDVENMLKTNDFTFIAEEGKTTIQLNTSCMSKSYIVGCILPFYKSILKQQDQEYLNNFKSYIEK